MNNLPIIICASGNSVPFLNSQFYRTKCGLPQKLVDIIKGNYSIGLNYWFKYGCTTTFNCSGDWQFYEDNYQDLGKVPMIVASADPQLKNNKVDRTHKNTILLPNSGKYYGKDSISKGIYTKHLIGIWTLSLVIALGFKEIYLLGYDCKEINGQTHFYQGVIDLKKSTPIYVRGEIKDNRKHFRGVGKDNKGKYNTSTYDHKKHLNEKWFAPFHSDRETRKNIKIYNVSPDSAIDIFPKINYEQFYKQVENNHINQEEARKEIKRIIAEKSDE